jgi:hypothetical protein
MGDNISKKFQRISGPKEHLKKRTEKRSSLKTVFEKKSPKETVFGPNLFSVHYFLKNSFRSEISRKFWILGTNIWREKICS